MNEQNTATATREIRPQSRGELAVVPEEVSPLPEIIIPESLNNERVTALHALLRLPPQVDLLIIPERSAPLALAGIDGVDLNIPMVDLPIGRELFNIFYAEEEQRGTETGLDCGLGVEASEEAKERFRSWLRSTANSRVRAILAEIQSRLQHMGLVDKPEIAIVDDICETQSVALGITPAVLDVILGEENYVYHPGNNKYIFQSTDWLYQIVKATFSSEDILDPRVLAFLVELAKGYPDDYWHTEGGRPYDGRNMTEAIAHFSKMFMVSGRGEVPKGTDSIDKIVERYGNNLLLLHQKVFESLRKSFPRNL